MDLLSLPAAGSFAVTSSPLLRFRFDDPLLASTEFAVSFSRATKKLSALHAVNTPAANFPGASYPPGPVHTAASSASISSAAPCSRWKVVMETPPGSGPSKAEVIDYYVETLARVLGSEREAQMCIYDASWQNQYGFCCDIDEESARELARMRGVVSVKPDTSKEYGGKDYNHLDPSPVDQVKTDTHSSIFLSSLVSNKYWLVQVEKPSVEVVTKAQMVDYYAQILTKVLGNEKDAQVCIYHISWEKDFGFCCQIDEECAQELADVPEVFSVRPDVNKDSNSKDYKGNESNSSDSTDVSKVRTKRLFVTGLSFYTSEKTLRAAFEGFGELVEVKIIMDKISKRSKGYAFIEYTTEEAASAALKEMNGKIINGWMIVVDVAKTNPPRISRGRPRPSSPSSSSPITSY